MARVFFYYDPVTGEMKSTEPVVGIVSPRENQEPREEKPAPDQHIGPGRPRIYDPICKMEGCRGKHRAQGLCGMHYERMRRNGDPSISKRNYRKRAKEPWDVKKERDLKKKRNIVIEKAVEEGIMTAEDAESKFEGVT